MWTCPGCGEQPEASFRSCWNCGTEDPGSWARELLAEPSPLLSTERYLAIVRDLPWPTAEQRRNFAQYIGFALSLWSLSFSAVGDEHRWWPIQTMPQALVRLQEEELAEPRAAREMMAQSVAGLAPKAVNEGRADEMV